MAIGSTLESQILLLLLAASANPIANIAATAGSTVLWAALHTADPTGGTGQNQSEVSLTGYTRVSVDRSTGAAGWTVSGSQPASASPNGQINFPRLTSTSTGTATFASVGTSSSGTGQIIMSGSLSPTISLSQNVSPSVTTGSSLTLT